MKTGLAHAVVHEQPHGSCDRGVRSPSFGTEIAPVAHANLLSNRTVHDDQRKQGMGCRHHVVHLVLFRTHRLDGGDENRHDAGRATCHDGVCRDSIDRDVTHEWHEPRDHFASAAARSSDKLFDEIGCRWNDRQAVGQFHFQEKLIGVEVPSFDNESFPPFIL